MGRFFIQSITRRYLPLISYLKLDSNEYLLNWIKENPRIDKAIILTMYWMSEPYYAKQFKNRDEVKKKQEWYLENFDFIEDIEKRYCEGFYKESNLKCDPKNVEQLQHYNELADRTIKNPNMKPIREIPSLMYQKLSGKKVKPINYYAYTEGLPNNYYDRIEQIFKKYEIEYQ